MNDLTKFLEEPNILGILLIFFILLHIIFLIIKLKNMFIVLSMTIKLNLLISLSI